MKIERVAHNKIKITLTCDDMQMWQLDIEKLSSNAPEAREFFLNVIERAENELNFDFKDSQLLVEAFMKTDGSVIHISKISPETEEFDKLSKARIKRVEVRVRRKPTAENRCVVFSFNTFDNAADACKLISPKFDGYSTFYKYNDSFYIALYFTASADKQVVSVLSEFGTQAENNIIGRLNEHGETLIKENAVITLSEI